MSKANKKRKGRKGRAIQAAEVMTRHKQETEAKRARKALNRRIRDRNRRMRLAARKTGTLRGTPAPPPVMAATSEFETALENTRIHSPEILSG